ncbi:TolB family protein [Streptomyces sp. NPDC017941]|uniref:TolB family protein n=1 Tax=Streptomyces sp. NPDC017941 TaxID=3365018 RepID=UPI00379C8666
MTRSGGRPHPTALWTAVLGLALSTAPLAAATTAHAEPRTDTGRIATAHAEPRTGTARNATAHAPLTRRVSTTADGAQLDGASGSGSISADGGRVAFVTQAPALGCAPYLHCLKVKDLATGALTGIDLGSGHLYGNPLLSADGSRVAFTATKRFAAPHLYDGATGTVTRLWPQDPPGRNELGAVAAISPDGTRVAYTIGNRNGDQNARLLYVRSTTTGDDELISGPEEGDKGGASVTDDGSRVAYQIGGYSEGPDDRGDVFLKEPATGARTQLDTGLGSAELVRLTDDGRHVLLNARGGLYVHTVRTGTTERVAEGRARSATADGRYAALSDAAGLRLHDLRTGRGESVGPADARAAPGAVAAGGRAVVFGSEAADLVPGDTNGAADVFLWTAKRGRP